MFRHKDEDYVLELVPQHPLYGGCWGVRRAESDQYIVVRKDRDEAKSDAIRDVDALDTALNQGLSNWFQDPH